MKIRFLTMVLIMLATIYSHAGSISCITATGLVPDGSALDFDSVQASTDSWYRFTAAAGRSYSIAVRDDLDLDNPDLTVTFYGNGAFPPSSCLSPSPAPQLSAGSGYTDTTTTEPALPANAKRVSIVTPSSFTGGASANTYWIKVHNGSSTTSHYVSVSVTETTLYAMNWSTYGGLGCSFAFQNTTSQNPPITFILTATATSPGPVQTYTATGTLGAVGTVSSTAGVGCGSGTGNLNMAANQSGYAIFTHNGPPGAVQAFALDANYGTTPYTLLPIPMGPMRGK